MASLKRHKKNLWVQRSIRGKFCYYGNLMLDIPHFIFDRVMFPPTAIISYFFNDQFNGFCQITTLLISLTFVWNSLENIIFVNSCNNVHWCNSISNWNHCSTETLRGITWYTDEIHSWVIKYYQWVFYMFSNALSEIFTTS